MTNPSEGANVGAAPRRSSVLIVEDDPDMLEFLRDVVAENLTVRIDTAANAEQAFQLTRARRPDVILLDLYLPGIDGFRMCRRLKMDPATRPIKVIGITGAAEWLEAREKALDAGCDAFVHKLYSFHQLVPALRQELG